MVFPMTPATFAMPMLLDSAMMSESIMVSTGCGCESWIVYWSTCIDAGTWNRWVSDTAPDSSAAAAVMILFTDPGSNASVTVRLRHRSGSVSANRLGSNDGKLAMARMSPVLGSITITVPAFAPLSRTALAKACCVWNWMSRSIVVRRLTPSTGSVSALMPCAMG